MKNNNGHKTLKAYRPQRVNANKHTPIGLRELRNGIGKYGIADGITVAADGESLSGSARLETLAEIMPGVKIVEVETDGNTLIVNRRTDIPNAKSKRGQGLSAAINIIQRLDYNPDGEILAALAAEDDYMAALVKAERDSLRAVQEYANANGNADAEPQMDRAEELRIKWGVERGQLWRIGEHRLLCGDSTVREDVERVMGGEKAAICLTDPPYGIGLDYGGFDDTEVNVAILAKQWLPIARDTAAVVVFSPGVTRQWLYPEPSWVICWFYGGGQLRSPWGFNCWQPFLCYGKDPSLAIGRGARPDAVDMNIPANSADLDHPCPKPLRLIEWLIERLSFSVSETVFDPFTGSGTTLVACQNLSRRCRAIEISPAYCAVTLQRMSDAFPGIEIERIP